MADDILKLIPVDPVLVPDARAQEQARSLLSSFVSGSVEVRIVVHDEVAFIDSGGNLEDVRCPACNSILETGWWQAAMDRAYQSRFADLTTQVPCCGKFTSLNDLKYRMPAGFAKFSLQARNPNLGKSLDESKMRMLEEILKCKLRQVWAHF